MKKIILIFFIFFSSTLLAQNNPDIKRTMHWYFGFGAGLDFSGGSPVADTTGVLYADEACFTMSDTCGNLLFYGKSDTLYNKNHQMMDNGDLIPPPPYTCPVVNPTQIVCIPQPMKKDSENDSLFYLFYTSMGCGRNKLFYAIVNIKMNGGLGSVVLKDIVLLDTNVSEKVAAVKHCNGIDYWITGKRFEGINAHPDGPKELFNWLLTEDGISTIPVISDVGKRLFELGGGYFRFSPDGSKAAEVIVAPSQIDAADSSFIQIFDYNNCTGQFSNPILIPFPCPYGIAFSPDNTKIYTAAYSQCLGAGIMDTLFLAQYDISVYDSNAIANAKTVLFIGTNYSCEAIQLGLDGKLYLCDDNFTDNASLEFSDKHLGVINNPNALGIACNYWRDSLFLGSRTHFAGLPNFVDSYFSSFIYSNCNVGIQEIYSGDEVNIYPNPAFDFINIHCSSSGVNKIRIYNITGEMLIEKNLTNENNVFDIHSLISGLYFIQISTKNNSLITYKKFIKL